MFTKIKDKNKLKKRLKYMNYFKLNSIFDLNKISYDEDENKYVYRDNNLIFSFRELSDYTTNEVIKEELTSSDRVKNNIIRSISLASKIKNSKVAIGYITLKNKKVLNVVVLDDNLEPSILDYGLNIKTSKDEYIKLTNFTQISSIDIDIIKDDIKLFNNLFNIDLMTYLVFRNEIIKSLDKNKELILK